MLLDAPGDGGLRPVSLAVRVETVKAELAAVEDIAGRLRCALYVDLFLDNNGLPELFEAREYQALGCSPFPARDLVGLSR